MDLQSQERRTLFLRLVQWQRRRQPQQVGANKGSYDLGHGRRSFGSLQFWATLQDSKALSIDAPVQVD